MFDLILHFGPFHSTEGFALETLGVYQICISIQGNSVPLVSLFISIERWIFRVDLSSKPETLVLTTVYDGWHLVMTKCLTSALDHRQRMLAGPHSQSQGSEPSLLLFLGSEQSSYMVPGSPMVQGTLRVGVRCFGLTIMFHQL